MQHMLFTFAIALCVIPLCAPLLAHLSPMWRFFTSSTPPLVLVGNGDASSTQLLPIGDILAQNTKPPKQRHRLRLAFIGAVLILTVCVMVGGGLLIAAQPAAQPVQAYLYVNPGHEVVFLQVQGALTSTTGTWLEADRTSKGVTRHQWQAQYAANDRTVHILLSTGDVVTGQIDNAQYSAMDLTLPVNAVGIFPPLAHFVAATPGDWNSAYTSLMASVGVTP